jgi:hypothetical protein
MAEQKNYKQDLKDNGKDSGGTFELASSRHIEV